MSADATTTAETTTETATDKTVADTTAKTTDAGNDAGTKTAADKTTLAADAGTDDERKPAAAWPDDWRQRLAAEDKGDLTALERLKEPKDLWAKVKNLEKRLNEKPATAERPGKDAKPEEVAAYRKSIGVPETPDGYLADLKLANNKVLGEADKPVAESFAAALHEVDAPPAVVARALDWYHDHIEKVATAEAEADDAFKQEQMQALKEDWGPADYKRNINAIGTLFKDAPEVKDILLSGRTSDGKLFGDDARVLRFLAKLAVDLNPAATVVLPGGNDAKSIAGRIAEIEAVMRTDRRAYDRDEAMQADYRRLLAARDQNKAA